MKNYLDRIDLNIVRRVIYLIAFIFSIFFAILILFYALGFNNYLSKVKDTNVKTDSNFSALDEIFSLTVPGPVGPIGPIGPQGLPGEKGETGAQGKPGTPGKQGSIGPVGPVGPPGSSGSTGATGATGSQGTAGPQGIQGPQGQIGLQGATGATGPKGEKGDQGEKGEKGDKGDPGSDGITTLGARGSFHDTTTQSITGVAVGTPKAMELNTTNSDETNGISITNNVSGRPTRITVANTGTYNLQFSAQLFRNQKNGTMSTDIWLSKNGSSVPMTNTRVTLTGTEAEAKSVAAWNFLIYLQANQFVELMWAVSDVDLIMPTITSTSTPAPSPTLYGPSIPSLIVTMTQVG